MWHFRERNYSRIPQIYMMKIGILNKIINAGANTDALPDYLLKRIKPANITSLILVFTVAIPFIIISMIYMPSLTFIPVIGALAGIGVIIVNFLGGFKYSRLFIAIVPVWQVMIYNAYLCGPEDEPVSSLFIVSISFLLTPFVKFDLREKGFLITSILLCSLAILIFPISKNWFTVDGDANIVKDYIELLETGWLSYVTVSLGIVAAVGSTLGMSIISRNSEKESEAMRKEAEVQKEQLQKEKLQREEDLVQLKLAQAVEKKRQWAVEGIANLSDILRSSLQEQEVYDRIVALVIKYLQANQGKLYVVNHNEEAKDVKIELTASFAYGRKKHLEQSFSPGQGLLGQTYLEGQTVQLLDIPQNYVKITSGLGEATPTALLIVPLKVNEIVEGVLEIASFKKFEEHDIEFVNKLGESVASYIQTNRINVRTKVLLEQAQEQAEELKSQEEEMRQNMEELAATQEEMQRKEQEYQRLIQELESKVATAHG